jgi:hypothetical protein
VQRPDSSRALSGWSRHTSGYSLDTHVSGRATSLEGIRGRLGRWQAAAGQAVARLVDPPQRFLDLINRPASDGRFRMRPSSEKGVGVTAEEWVLGYRFPLGARVRPLGDAVHDHASHARNDGRSGLPELDRSVPSVRGEVLGKVYNYAWSGGMTMGPVVALVLLWDERGACS